MGFWDVITYIGATLCGLIILGAMFSGGSAPQQAALAAMGIGVGVTPYFISATLHRAHMRRDRG